MTDCKRARRIANWDLALHRASKNREYHYRHQWIKILLPFQADAAINTPYTRDRWNRSELPDFDTMYRQWHHAMSGHDVAAAAIVDNAFTGPMKYFGYVSSESETMNLKNIRITYKLVKQRSPRAGGASFTAMVRHYAETPIAHTGLKARASGI